MMDYPVRRGLAGFRFQDGFLMTRREYDAALDALFVGRRALERASRVGGGPSMKPRYRFAWLPRRVSMNDGDRYWTWLTRYWYSDAAYHCRLCDPDEPRCC